jgi:hypothetical protein
LRRWQTGKDDPDLPKPSTTTECDFIVFSREALISLIAGALLLFGIKGVSKAITPTAGANAEAQHSSSYGRPATGSDERIMLGGAQRREAPQGTIYFTAKP